MTSPVPVRDAYQSIIDFSPIIISAIGLIFIYLQLKRIGEQNRNQINLLQSESKRMDFDRSVVKSQKALDMAEEFSILVDTDIPYIRGLYAGNKEYLNKISLSTMSRFKKFDFEEAKEIFGFANIEEVRRFISVDFLDNETLFDMYYSHYILDSEKFFYYEIKKANYDLEKLKAEKPTLALNIIDLEIKAKNQVSFTVFHLLNRLEWMSMHFNTGLADEDIVYQSLHQLYLHTVALLYYRIAEKNSAELTEKYYVNVIQLYVEWMQKVEEKREAIKDAERVRINVTDRIVGSSGKKI